MLIVWYGRRPPVPPIGDHTLNAHAAGAVQHPAVRPEWLARNREQAIEPDLPIIDAHHHLWGPPRGTYLLDDYIADTAGGHDIRATVFIECKTHYRADGDPLFHSLGETEFVADAAARAAARPAGPRVAKGIVGGADLRAGAAIRPVLEAHIAAGAGRFRGIRNIAAWHPDPAARGSIATPPPMLMLDPAFREGFAQLAPLGLRFDAWAYHTQLAELRDLADAFPDTPIVLNHVGGAIGIGPYAARRRHVEETWRDALRSLAHCPNVHLKLGGLGMRLFGFGFHEGAAPPDSSRLADAWRPWIETCVEIFGAERCMFESNFPVDKASCGYTELWNAFKRITAGWSAGERASLFHGSAARFYALGET
ncbi:amidohydrolase family protein [Plastoroseomonas hellenica]|uniref:amidohydrolase family protein n=1 Tax=Plastoroseomonas hellenica TaxID=2687306 RepID=UPI001BAE4B6F|nr:amidohydrolase family protein [Plastoroseomonas hellenica]MBR0646829.1 amidohydrolase family protein [Plastoroseomonas hellenica]